MKYPPARLVIATLGPTSTAVGASALAGQPTVAFAALGLGFAFAWCLIVIGVLGAE